MRLRLTVRALRDLESIEAYIEKENPAVAHSVMSQIAQAFDWLCLFPNLGRRSDRPGTRQMAIPGLPLVIVYRLAGETIDVLTVFHSAQHPDKKAA